MQNSPPRILIIGVGRFGRHHLSEWQSLAEAGKVVIAGLVVESAESAQHLRRSTGLNIYQGFDVGLLADVDAVDIVTPSAIHYQLVKDCLSHAHVLVEKPLVLSSVQAQELTSLSESFGHVLMTGHIYRFHPLSDLVGKVIAEIGCAPVFVECTFTNPADEFESGVDIFFEWIHIFDLFDFISQSPVVSCSAHINEGLAQASVRNEFGVSGVLKCGWAGLEPIRNLSIVYEDCRLHVDFRDGILAIHRRGKTEKQFVDPAPVALRNELEAFLSTCSGQSELKPSHRQVLDTISVAERARASAKIGFGVEKSGGTRPRVGVIGGGIFGAVCALELAEYCDVTLFEQHHSMLREASYNNQWRHHSGFHYPRSLETILEVQDAKTAFEAEFESVIHRDVDAYFAVSRLGEEISRERYLRTCDATGLRYEVVAPPGDIVDPDKVSVCIRTDEAVVDIEALSKLLMERMQASPTLSLQLNCKVEAGEFNADGTKALHLRRGQNGYCENFDFLVNASYANSNIIAQWFGFPVRPLRFDRLELAVYRIKNAPRFMMTLLDAPFTSLTTLGQDDLFILSHIHQSILGSEVGAKGLPPQWPDTPLNHHNLLRHGLRYLPILERADYIESRIGVRTVTAFSEDFDGRPTVVTAHGFGCWSVLGGKIITAVSNAREISASIYREAGLS